MGNIRVYFSRGKFLYHRLYQEPRRLKKSRSGKIERMELDNQASGHLMFMECRSSHGARNDRLGLFLMAAI